MILAWVGSMHALWPSLTAGVPWPHSATADAFWPFLCVVVGVLAVCSTLFRTAGRTGQLDAETAMRSAAANLRESGTGE
jgi:hypothetical protein